MQNGCVLRVWAEVEQGVLRQAGGQAELFWVGSLQGQEQTVSGDAGPRGHPHDQSTVLGHVGEMDISRGIRL